MFSIPYILPSLTHYVRQWATNDSAGLAKALLQSVLHVEFARVYLNSLAIQHPNLSYKYVQNP